MDSDPQRRGRQFEPLLRDLFAAFDLDPRGSFLAPGEQTDGSIRFNGSIILVEARWEQDPSSPRQTREFRAKVQDKLETTLGLYIAMAGFTEEAIRKAAEGRRLIVLMDGTDLAPVFQGVVDLRELLDRSRFAATEFDGTGFFTRVLKIAELFAGRFGPVREGIRRIMAWDARRFASANLFCIARKCPAASPEADVKILEDHDATGHNLTTADPQHVLQRSGVDE